MNKKGYFFLIDGIFALLILMIGFMIITSGKPTKLDEIPLTLVSENLVDILSSVKISEICEGCTCTIQEIQRQCNNRNIRNMDQSLLDYIGELYYLYDQGDNSKRQQISNVFSGIIQGLYRDELYGIELKINEDPNAFYSDGNKLSTKYLITSKRVVFGYYEDGNTGEVNFWGPYLVEINMWEK